MVKWVAMAILYALVVRGSVVLAEFTATSTDAGAISRQILEKIPGNDDSHASFHEDRYVFHVKRSDGLTVLCMADETAGSASQSHSHSQFSIFAIFSVLHCNSYWIFRFYILLPLLFSSVLLLLFIRFKGMYLLRFSWHTACNY